MATSDSDPILQPFLDSRRSRGAYSDRSSAILAALLKDGDDGVILSLPNESHDRRSSSTYAIRPPSLKERLVLFGSDGPCRCRISGGEDEYGSAATTATSLYVMYRVSGNGEGRGMLSWDVSSALARQASTTSFGGSFVVLGVALDGPDADAPDAITNVDSLERMAGVRDNGLVRDCILEPGCAVHRNGEVLGTHVMRGASVVGCGSVAVEDVDNDDGFNLREGSMDVEVGPEAGGSRKVRVGVESTLVDVCRDLGMDSGGKSGTVAPTIPIAVSTKDEVTTTTAMNILCPHSSVAHTPSVASVFLCPHSTIRTAASVSRAVLLPHATIKKGCTVSRALLQWNATLTSHSDASSVFLMERAEVGPHSFTANAVFGPDSHVSGGEVHCTLFGPNANAHHQSLLIGILWPLGRGNVGYGANVGSNHTGRIPDQETAVGEGTFWGLGCVIKFPVDITSSPYSIIAAGVQLPPQRISMPFALITEGPGGMNQITPGWLLHYSPYTVARSEVKFSNRRKAKRHDFYTGWKIIRPSTIDICVAARDALVLAGEKERQQSSGERSGSGGEGKKRKPPVFRTEKAIPGIGANQLTERGRQVGVEAYTDAIQRYALRGMLDRLVAAVGGSADEGSAMPQVLCALANALFASAATEVSETAKVDWTVLPWNEPSHSDPDALWEHQGSVLRKELPDILRRSGAGDDVGAKDVAVILPQLLERCAALEDDHAERVFKSKSRDDVRGASTVPGYAEAHTSAEDDGVVLAAREEAAKVRADASAVGRALGGGVGGPAKSRL